MLEDLVSLESSFHDEQSLSGTIRSHLCPFIAQRLLIPVLSKFTKANPRIEFDVEISEGFINLTESNRDLAIRIHDDPKDSGLIYRKLIPNRSDFVCIAEFT